MATKQHNILPEFESEPNPVEQTEYFTKFLNRFFKAAWFDKPNYLLVFMHLLKNVNWHKSTIIFKNEDFEVNIGECIISQTGLAKTLNISPNSVHDILKYFQKIGEVRMRATNAFTLVSITYLTENKKSVCQQNANRMPTEASIDKIDNKEYEDQYLTDNKLSVIENKKLKLEDKTKMSSKPKTKEPKAKVKSLFNDISVPEPKATKPPTFIDTLLDVWTEEFKSSRKIEYVVIKGKDTAAISKLLNVFKKQKPDLDTPSMLEYFRNFFKQVLAIDDQFIYTNISLAFIYSQINKINTLLLKGSKKQFVSSAGYEAVNPEYQSKF